MTWIQIKKKKKIVLKSHLLVFYTTMNHYSIKLWHATKSGFYTTVGNDQLSGWTEKKFQSTLQSQTCIHKRSWWLFGGLQPVSSTTAFWILAKLSHQRSMFSESMKCTENCNACIQHWSTEGAQFFSMKTPDYMSHNQCFKSWENCTIKFCLICHIHSVQLLSHLSCHIHLTSQQLTTISDNFFKRKSFHNQQETENAFQEFIESTSTDFYATGISKLNSHGKKCVDCNCSCFD